MLCLLSNALNNDVVTSYFIMKGSGHWPVATVAMKTSYFTDGYEAEDRQVLLVQLLLSALYISRLLTGGL